MFELTASANNHPPQTNNEVDNSTSKDSDYQQQQVAESKPIAFGQSTNYSYTSQSTNFDEPKKYDINSSESVKYQHENSNSDAQQKEAEEEHLSPIIDVKSIGSVLDRASMFEKKLEKEKQQKPTFLSSYHPNNHIANHALNLSRETVARLESIYGKRTEEVINNRVDKSSESGGEKIH
jgi:hypothetical protein